METTEIKSDIEAPKPQKMSSSSVKTAKTVIIKTGEEFNSAIIDNLLSESKDSRFSGSKTSSISLPYDISEPFDISVVDNVELSQRIVNVTTLTEGQKPFNSSVSTLKIPVVCNIKGQTYNANILLTPENEAEVKALLKNRHCMAITTHWEGLPNKKTGAPIAKLELVPLNAEQKQQFEPKTKAFTPGG